MRLKTYIEDNDLDARIAKARATLNALKLTAQRVGASNLVIKQTVTLDTWDVNSVVLTPFEEKKFRIEFTYDQAVAPLADLLIQTDVNNVALDEFQIEQYDDPENSELDTKKSWIVYAINWNFSTNAEFSLKAYIRCQDTGTITVTEI